MKGTFIEKFARNICAISNQPVMWQEHEIHKIMQLTDQELQLMTSELEKKLISTWLLVSDGLV